MSFQKEFDIDLNKIPNLPKEVETVFFLNALEDIIKKHGNNKDLKYKYIYRGSQNAVMKIEDKHYRIRFDSLYKDFITHKIASFELISKYKDLFVVPKNINYNPDYQKVKDDRNLFLYYEIDYINGYYDGTSYKKMDEFLKKLNEFSKEGAYWDDFSMSNIITDSRGNIKIIDFDIYFESDLQNIYDTYATIEADKIETYIDVMLTYEERYRLVNSIAKIKNIYDAHEYQKYLNFIILYQFKHNLWYEYIPDKLYAQINKNF